MFEQIDATAMLATHDLDRARAFYSDVMGFVVRDDSDDGIVSFKSGTTPIALYESDYAGTNQANALAWSVGDAFDTPSCGRSVIAGSCSSDTTICRGCGARVMCTWAEGFKAAWFKDPDGNILHINGR